MATTATITKTAKMVISCVLTLVFASAFLVADDTSREGDIKHPAQWPFAQYLGQDEPAEVVLGCVYRHALERVRPPFATVVLYVTVVGSFKGSLKPGDKIIVTFPTDDLPLDAEARSKRIALGNEGYVGSLRFCFLGTPQKDSNRFSCEWLNVRKFTPELNESLTKYYRGRH